MASATVIDVVMPQMGVSVSEGTIVKWLVDEGGTIEADAPLLEISTDKVDTEVPSPGTRRRHEDPRPGGRDGGRRDEARRDRARGGGAGGRRARAGACARARHRGGGSRGRRAVERGDARAGRSCAEPAPAAAPASDNGKTFVSPVVARIAAEHGVDVGSVQGTGQGGRVTKKDILAFIEAGAPPTPRRPLRRAPEPSAPAPAPPQQPARSRRPRAAARQVEPMSAMRKGIAEHMRRSLDTAAHVTSAIEVDMSKVVAIREKLKAEFQRSYGVNPTYLIFVARATTETLLEYPWVNGEIRGDQIVTRNYVNLGFAVELADGKGLIVPVVRNAEGLNLLGMARAVTDIAERARSKQLLPDDVQGGTFTITNPGGYGTFHGTPVISQPQAGILGTYALVKRPWVVEDDQGNDAIAIRPIMNITLTYDHRLVDGALAGRFLRDLREKLQTWGEDKY